MSERVEEGEKKKKAERENKRRRNLKQIIRVPLFIVKKEVGKIFL